jgi:GNAT superfamily N-acetyltransferase
MRASVLELFPQFYDERQTASAAVYVAHVDSTLVADGTYFVSRVRRRDRGVLEPPRSALHRLTRPGWRRPHPRPGDEAAHIRAMFVRPDWTRRGLGRAILKAGHDAARSDGFRRLDLGATLPVALYRAFGFQEVERFVVTMPDRVTLDAVVMDAPSTLRANSSTCNSRVG